MAICVVQKFANYFGLRNGCIIIGILGMFGRLIFGLGDAIVFISHKGIFDQVDDLTTAHIAVCLANGILGIVAASTILHGAFGNCRKTVLIYLILVPFLIILIFASMLIGTTTLSGETLQNVKRHHACDENCKWTVSVTTYVVVFDAIDFLCYIYFWICARSYYYELGGNSVYNIRAYI